MNRLPTADDLENPTPHGLELELVELADAWAAQRELYRLVRNRGGIGKRSQIEAARLVLIGRDLRRAELERGQAPGGTLAALGYR